MLRSLSSAIDALDTLYEPIAVCSQFLGSASMTFLSLFPSLLPLLVLSFLALLYFLAFLYFRVFYFLSFFAFLSFISLPFSFLFFVSFFQLT